MCIFTDFWKFFGIYKLVEKNIIWKILLNRKYYLRLNFTEIQPYIRLILNLENNNNLVDHRMLHDFLHYRSQHYFHDKENYRVNLCKNLFVRY